MNQIWIDVQSAKSDLRTPIMFGQFYVLLHYIYLNLFINLFGIKNKNLKSFVTIIILTKSTDLTHSLW